MTTIIGMYPNAGNCSYQLILASVGRVPIIEMRVALKHLYCPLHCGLHGVVPNILTFDISHSSAMTLKVASLVTENFFSGRPEYMKNLSHCLIPSISQDCT